MPSLFRDLVNLPIGKYNFVFLAGHSDTGFGLWSNCHDRIIGSVSAVLSLS